jgi:transglutaminase-like putative cysteine protease
MAGFACTASLVLGHSCLGSAKYIPEWRDEVTYQVTVRTSLEIEEADGVSNVIVIHALPVQRDWSPGVRRSSARNISTSPKNGKIKYDRETDGPYVEWEVRVPKKGGVLEFSTTYETTSATRYPSGDTLAKAKWGSRRLEKSGDIHPEVYDKAKELSAENNPASALAKFSEWLRERVKYDASVDNRGVAEILTNGAGHCGHRAEVMIEFAKALNIPVRLSSGSNLVLPDGGTNHPSFALKPTWSNTHVWLEFEVPGVGWIEAEPAAGDKIFEIPSNYVRTRGVAQNFAVKLFQNGKWDRPRWQFVEEGGVRKFLSNVGLRNVISFSTMPGASPQEDAQHQTSEIAEADSPDSPEDSPKWDFGRAHPPADISSHKNEGGGEIKTGTLSKAVKFALKRDGFHVGFITVAAGGAVSVLDHSNNMVLIQRATSEPKWIDAGAVLIP